jgi:Icc protein
VHGRLGAPQLSWIEETLRAMVPGPTLVFVHHPPIPTGIDWLDPHVIEEGDELVRILVAREVGHLFFGHVHQPMTLERHGLVAVGSAATCFGFGGDGDAPMLLDGPPGLTWIDVVGDQVRSRVEYLPIS